MGTIGKARAAIRREQAVAWGISLLVHAALLLLLAAAGVFRLGAADEQAQEPVDIVMADPSTSGGTGAKHPAGGGQTSSISLPASAELGALPEIGEDYTRDPSRREAYRAAHQTAADAAAEKPRPAAPSASAKSAAEAAGAQGSTVGAAGRTSGTGGTGGASGTGRPGGAGSGGTGDGGSHGGGSDNGARTDDAGGEPAAAVCTYRAEPQYPPSLIDEEAQGSVTLLLAIGRDNTVTGVTVLSSSGYRAMDQAAISAAHQCRFQTYGQLGRFRITYTFRLQ